MTKLLSGTVVWYQPPRYIALLRIGGGCFKPTPFLAPTDLVKNERLGDRL